jgi:hypothetical protein
MERYIPIIGEPKPPFEITIADIPYFLNRKGEIDAKRQKQWQEYKDILLAFYKQCHLSPREYELRYNKKHIIPRNCNENLPPLGRKPNLELRQQKEQEKQQKQKDKEERKRKKEIDNLYTNICKPILRQRK